AIEHADVVESEEPALENIHSIGVFAIHPPGEVQKQLVENAFQESAIAFAIPLLVDLINAPCGPGMHRRIYISKCPLIRGKLTIGMHVPFAQQKHELLLCEIGIN